MGNRVKGARSSRWVREASRGDKNLPCCRISEYPIEILVIVTACNTVTRGSLVSYKFLQF